MKTADRIKSISEYYFATKLREIRHRQASGEDIINLGIGSPDLSPPEAVKVALQNAIAADGSFMYKPYLGIPSLREAMATFYRWVYNVDVSETNFVPTLGSKEAIGFISLAYLNPGDEVLVPNPGYPAYEAAAQLAGANCIKYDLEPSLDWHPDPTALEQLITDKTRIIWLNYPNMPTGANANRYLLEKIVALATRRNLLICHDNPYSTILTTQPFSILSVTGAVSNTIELNSLSKAFNMAGARVGMMCGGESLINEVFKVQSQFSSGMFEPVQHAAVKALGLCESDWFDKSNNKYAERRAVVFRFLKILECSFDERSGGMFVWARIPAIYSSGEQLSEILLNRASVFVAPGHIFGSNGMHYIRISLCSPLTRLEEAETRIQRLINEST